ncbi:MAG: PA2779 family protein [Gammaproteobacteria bacterium]|nr:PA2779 family protein [Gammaproteobacteria bacterium]MCW8957744.1 PA2779 family protein [Gammaproteobacteria bacterium]MCW8992974.1 PA2779 family protein [Gammaproteobacteria bacterium]
MMKRNYRIKQVGVMLLSVALLGGQLTPAYAAMTSTTTLLQQEQRAFERSQLLEALERESVQTQLRELGVDAEAAKQRVAAMTDGEIRQLNARLAEMPAGGDILGAVLVVFIVLVITDMLGATDVFPFVKSVNN